MQLAAWKRHFESELARAQSLVAAGRSPPTPRQRRLIRQTGWVLIVTGLILIALTGLLLHATGRVMLALVGFGLFALCAGAFSVVRGRLWMPPSGASAPSPAELAPGGECPACGRAAAPSGEYQSHEGRDYAGMHCTHCGNRYWSYRNDEARLRANIPG